MRAAKWNSGTILIVCFSKALSPIMPRAIFLQFSFTALWFCQHAFPTGKIYFSLDYHRYYRKQQQLPEIAVHKCSVMWLKRVLQGWCVLEGLPRSYPGSPDKSCKGFFSIGFWIIVKIWSLVDTRLWKLLECKCNCHRYRAKVRL